MHAIDLADALRDRFALERELGRGGMATVYLAQDLKNRRSVAIKVLHPELAGVLGHERFLREVSIVAGLRHPHIMPLYDSGDAHGYLFQVMPVAEGESLRDRLAKVGQLSIDEALQIAAEVADALSYAHKHGVIHRDIKPGNILLESGHAVVADFGIARAIDAAAAGQNLTATGLAVGTAAYMSPEQVAAEPDVDARSDLYSLGCVLYEMIAGQPPFVGTPREVAQQQMVATPRAIEELRPSTPPEVSALIARALAKLSQDRFPDADEMRAQLDAARMHTLTHAVPVAAAGARVRAPARTGILIGMGAAALLAVVVGIFFVARRPIAQLELGRRTQVTLGAGLEIFPALSPNGDLLAYTSGRDSRLFVRQVEGGIAIPVARDLAGAQAWPNWSPDGKQLSFSSPRGIEIVPALGGVPRLLVLAPPNETSNGRLIVGGPWSRDGRALTFVRGDTLLEAPLDGSAPRAIASAHDLHSCAWSLDGKHIACVSGNAQSMTLGPIFGNLAQSSIVVAPSAGGSFARVVDDGSSNSSPAWMPDGALLYVSSRDGGRDVYSVRMNDKGLPASTPRRITTGLNALTITVPASGTRVGYAAFAESSNIWSVHVPTVGHAASVDDAKQLSTGDQVIESFHISRDGKWMAFDSDRSGTSHLYRMAPDGATEPERLTRDSTSEFYPAWSPDSRTIAFHSFRAGHRQLFLVPADGGPSTLIDSTALDDRSPTWSADGRSLMMLSNYGSANEDEKIMRRDEKGAWSAPVHWRTPACMPTPSPDGAMVACAELGGRLLLVTERGDSLRVLAAGMLIPQLGQFPQWSADGKSVYFLGEDSGVTSIFGVSVNGGAPWHALRFDDPLRPWHRYGFQLFGDRFYFTMGDRQSHVWVAEVVTRVESRR